jgi:hypothetical protein
LRHGERRRVRLDSGADGSHDPRRGAVSVVVEELQLHQQVRAFVDDD